MNKKFQHLSIFTICCLAIFGLPGNHLITRAQQTPTDEVIILPLPVPTNVIGTFIDGTSNDGKRIVFDSINDYNGNNVDSNTEIWVYDVDSRSVIQITNTQDIKDPNDANKVLTKISCVAPVISGDGTKIAFVSNASLGDSVNDNGNYEIYLADLPRGATSPAFTRITSTGTNFDTEFIKEIFTNYGPSISDDGSLIAYVSTRRVFNPIPDGGAGFTAVNEGPNNSAPDGNAEIFLYNHTQKQYSQVTVTRDEDATENFIVKGFNSRPVLSGDGRTMVFLSGFNYPGPNANRNSDFNGEIFVYKLSDPANSFSQVTETNSRVGTNTDLPAVPNNGVINVLASSTHPLSADGTRLVFESSANFAGMNGDTLRTREVFLANLSGPTPAFTQITNQGAADAVTSDFNFLPSINAAGTFITFTTVQNIVPTNPGNVKTDNADGSKEVFRYDIANGSFRQLTFAPSTDLFLDERGNTYSSFIDNSGSLASFSLVAQLLAPSASTVSDLFQAFIRPITSRNSQEAKIANAASFDMTQVARGSLGAIFGTQMADSAMSAPSANLPFELNGVTVSVGGLAARLIFVSDLQINAVLPSGVGNGDAVDFTINNNGVQSAGKVKIVENAPGVFSASNDGTGPAAAQCVSSAPDGMNLIFANPPCAVGNEAQFTTLVVYGTGWRNSSSTQLKIGDQTLTPTFTGAQPNFPGLDQINVTLTRELAGRSDQDLSVVIPATTPIESNKVKISFLPFEEVLTVANAASFESGVIAPGSSAFAMGMRLAETTASGPPGFEIEGVRMTVANEPALLTAVSPTQVNFIVPAGVAPANLVEVIVNNNGTVSRGRVNVLQSSPGVFTTTGDGNGRASVQCGRPNPDGSITYTDPPCAVGTEANPFILRVFGTGWRFADAVSIRIGDVGLIPTFVGPQPNALGVDLIDVRLATSLARVTDVDVIVDTMAGSTTKSSKEGIKVSFTP